MFNGFVREREETRRVHREQEKERELTLARKREKRNEEMRTASLNRVASWASKHLDSQITYGSFQSVLQDGSMALNHPSNHQFRGSPLDERVRNMYFPKEKQNQKVSHQETTGAEKQPAPLLSPKGVDQADDRFDAFKLVLPPISDAKKQNWMSPVSSTQKDFNRFGRDYMKDAPWKSPANYLYMGTTQGNVNIQSTLRARNKSEELTGRYIAPASVNAWNQLVHPVGSLRSGVSSQYLVKLSPLYEDKEYFKKKSQGTMSVAELQLKMRDGKVYRKSIETFLSHAYRKGGVSSSTNLNLGEAGVRSRNTSVTSRRS